MSQKINTHIIHPSWQKLVQIALSSVDPAYLQWLENHHKEWLPGPDCLFNAFSLPLEDTHFILLGESPYPRQKSANGYAFWDAAVTTLWSQQGLSKEVNRATSLRNFIKMLFVAEGKLNGDNTSPDAIRLIDKSGYITSIEQLFQNLLANGFLLLNASLVLSNRPKVQDGNAWRPFMQTLLAELKKIKPEIKLILLGQIAHAINKLGGVKFDQLVAEHPYNLSFITNPTIIEFFRPFKLLSSHTHSILQKQRVLNDEH